MSPSYEERSYREVYRSYRGPSSTLSWSKAAFFALEEWWYSRRWLS